MTDVQVLMDHQQTLDEKIAKLLQERQEILVLYRQVAGLDPDTATVSGTEYLQEFCQVLVEYIAMGHFEIYQQVAEDLENNVLACEVAARTYPALLETTDKVVAFNDKYENQQIEDEAALAADLSELGEVLANRVDLEDQLIDCLVKQ